MELSDIKNIAVIGAGLIGSAWATSFSRAGYKVNLYDVKPEALPSALDKIRTNFGVYVENGVMDQKQVDESMARITCCEKMEDAVKDVQFIQESGLEKIEVKKDIVNEIDQYNTTAIVSSSTSGLNISDIAADSPYANRYIGGHPYNPPHLMPLVEITQWEKTDKALVQVAYEFYESINKVPVILLKETPGFIGNRLQMAYVREAIALVREGICTIEDVDKTSVYGLGLRYAIVGPYLNGDMNAPGGIANYLGPTFGAGISRQFKRVKECPIDAIPEDMPEIAAKGVEEEKARRPQETGNTREEIMIYRDKLLMQILKLHGKL